MESPKELASKVMDACIDLCSGRTTVRVPVERVVERARLSIQSGRVAVKFAAKEGWLDVDDNLVRLTGAGRRQKFGLVE